MQANTKRILFIRMWNEFICTSIWPCFGNTYIIILKISFVLDNYNTDGCLNNR